MIQRHGGDIYNNTVSLDFSVNLNPAGCPAEVKKAMIRSAERAGEYPDPEQSAARHAIAQWLGIPPQLICCAAGASEIFTVLMNMLRPSCVLLVSPCFGGYEHAALTSPGCRIKRHILREEDGFRLTDDYLEELTDEVDVCFLCDPNNPTARTADKELMIRILKRCKDKGIKLIADECFYELSSQSTSLISHIGEYEGLFVVRAFTKLLAVPGVRLGYLVSAEDNIRKVKHYLPEWALSVFAEAAAVSGARVLTDPDYLNRLHGLIETERSFLEDAFRSLGIKVYPGSGNFMLIRSDKDLYGKLLDRKILIRDCSDFLGEGKGYYRIAVKKHGENMILAETLKEVL